MGGELCVAVRKKNGEEQVSLRWTDPMIGWLTDSGFYTQGKKLARFLAEATPEGKWPQSKLIERIEPSEYGVLFVDFATRKVFSRQNYMTPGCVWGTANREYDPERAAAFLNLKRLGWVKRVLPVVRNLHEPLSSELEAAFFEMLAGHRRYDDDERLRSVVVEYEVPGWSVDHSQKRALACWPDVVAWLKNNAWTSPTAETAEA